MSSQANNVRAFTHYQINNVPNALRMLAAKIEAGDESAQRAVVVLESEQLHDDSTNVTYKAFGADLTPHHAAGMLELAKLLVLGW